MIACLRHLAGSRSFLYWERGQAEWGHLQGKSEQHRWLAGQAGVSEFTFSRPQLSHTLPHTESLHLHKSASSHLGSRCWWDSPPGFTESQPDRISPTYLQKLVNTHFVQKLVRGTFLSHRKCHAK